VKAARRKERAGPERRLEGLELSVLTALGERDGGSQERGKRLGAMSDEEGLSVREAVDWCGTGSRSER
jgi:hypothetical protein